MFNKLNIFAAFCYRMCKQNENDRGHISHLHWMAWMRYRFVADKMSREFSIQFSTKQHWSVLTQCSVICGVDIASAYASGMYGIRKLKLFEIKRMVRNRGWKICKVKLAFFKTAKRYDDQITFYTMWKLYSCWRYYQHMLHFIIVSLVCRSYYALYSAQLFTNSCTISTNRITHKSLKWQKQSIRWSECCEIKSSVH